MGVLPRWTRSNTTTSQSRLPVHKTHTHIHTLVCNWRLPLGSKGFSGATKVSQLPGVVHIRQWSIILPAELRLFLCNTRPIQARGWGPNKTNLKLSLSLFVLASRKKLKTINVFWDGNMSLGWWVCAHLKADSDVQAGAHLNWWASIFFFKKSHPKSLGKIHSPCYSSSKHFHKEEGGITPHLPVKRGG